MKNPSRVILTCTAIVGLMAFGAGCGSGSDGENDASAETASSASHESALRYTLASMNDHALDAKDMDTLNRPSGQLNLQTRKAVHADFPCGSISTRNNAIEFTFEGDKGCADIDGTVKVSLETGDRTEWRMEYTDLTVGDCLIDGSAWYAFNHDGNTLTGSYTCDNLTVCGNTYDNTVSFSVTNETEGISYSLSSENHEYEGSVSVETDIDVTVDNGEIEVVNGTATAVVNGEVFTCTANSLVINWECGLPESGTLTVTGPDGSTAVADFTGVSCDNPEVTYTLNGKEFPCGLEDVITLFRTTNTPV